MRVRCVCMSSLMLAVGLIGWTEAPGADGAGPSKPATCKVEKGPIKVTTTLKGIVESEKMDEVALSPEAFTLPLTVVKAVEHGTVVKKGDVLVELDLEKIDQAIKDLGVELSQAELALKHADRELPVLEKLLPMDLAAAERSKARSAEDLARFLETDKPLAVLGVEFNDKSADFQLESSEDELAQLLKMYRSKDLTEETEQMILKRHRFMVEMAKFMLKVTKNQSEQTLKVELPRRELTVREEADRQSLALEKTRNLAPLEIGQKRVARDKLAYEQAKNGEKLAKLQDDRKAMTVRSPSDGIVFHGKAMHGQWTTAAAVAPRLTKGGVLAPQEVFLTVVAPRPAFIRATVEEKDLSMLHAGLGGQAVPTGYPGMKLPAKLATVSAVPLTPGNFDARVDVDLAAAPAIQPGMACSVRFLSYRKDDALTIPESAVFSDPENDERYVYLPGAEGKPTRRMVTVGKVVAGRAEIVEGLKEGDEILAAKP